VESGNLLIAECWLEEMLAIPDAKQILRCVRDWISHGMVELASVEPQHKAGVTRMADEAFIAARAGPGLLRATQIDFLRETIDQQLGVATVGFPLVGGSIAQAAPTNDQKSRFESPRWLAFRIRQFKMLDHHSAWRKLPCTLLRESNRRILGQNEPA